MNANIKKQSDLARKELLKQYAGFIFSIEYVDYLNYKDGMDKYSQLSIPETEKRLHGRSQTPTKHKQINAEVRSKSAHQR